MPHMHVESQCACRMDRACSFPATHMQALITSVRELNISSAKNNMLKCDVCAFAISNASPNIPMRCVVFAVAIPQIWMMSALFVGVAQRRLQKNADTEVSLTLCNPPLLIAPPKKKEEERAIHLLTSCCFLGLVSLLRPPPLPNGGLASAGSMVAVCQSATSHQGKAFVGKNKSNYPPPP